MSVNIKLALGTPAAFNGDKKKKSAVNGSHANFHGVPMNDLKHKTCTSMLGEGTHNRDDHRRTYASAALGFNWGSRGVPFETGKRL